MSGTFVVGRRRRWRTKPAIPMQKFRIRWNVTVWSEKDGWFPFAKSIKMWYNKLTDRRKNK